MKYLLISDFSKFDVNFMFFAGKSSFSKKSQDAFGDHFGLLGAWFTSPGMKNGTKGAELHKD